MPKHVKARGAQDEQEERQIHKLARSHHAPADWKFHAQMVVESWAGKTQIADRSRTGLPSQNGAHPPRTVQRRGDHWPGDAGRGGTQAPLERAGAQLDSRAGQATASQAG